MYPVVYEIPYHYANPVTGRTELPPLPPVAQQLKDYPLPPPPAPRVTNAPAGMPADVASGLREIGPKIDGVKTTALYAPLFKDAKLDDLTVQRDAAYGPHERHRVDVFTSKEKATKRPILVFIHGGGFSRGGKSAPNSPYFDNIGAWAARQGFVGVTLNYRLAPQFQYPAGAEDLARAVAWLRSHAKDYGGDANRIFLWGHSAGGAHVGDYLARTAKPNIAGAILTSGIYDLGDTVSIWKDYYGEDVSKYAQSFVAHAARQGADAVARHFRGARSAELPRRHRQAARGAQGERQAARRAAAAGAFAHFETYAIGTADESLAKPVADFVKAH